jgi:beta-lactamase class A
MRTPQRFMDATLLGDTLRRPTRREFLAVLASCSAGLLLGTPSFAQAGSASSLQGRVSDLVAKMRRERLILADEQTSWSVYDFSTRTKLVSINEDTPRQAASMIKPFVAQAYFYTMDDTKALSYSADVRRTMESMIRRSNNPATNRIMELVSRHAGNSGPPAVERVLKSKAPGIFVQTRIVEYIPTGGRTYRNLASARDYSRFLYALWNDGLPHARELRDLMALPNRDRITHGVSGIPERVRVYDKTGSTAKLCGNMGIVEAAATDGTAFPYTFIGIIERSSRAKDYGSWISRRSDAIRAVSNLVYLDMKKRHRLA